MPRTVNLESAPWPSVAFRPDVVIRRADGSIEPAVTLNRTKNGYVRLQLRSGETIKTAPSAIIATDRAPRFTDALRVAERFPQISTLAERLTPAAFRASVDAYSVNR